MTTSPVETAIRSATVIDLGILNNPLLVGRDAGAKCREQFGLEAEDVIFYPVEVLIPESTYSMSSSFFLGMFGKSIHAAGSAAIFFSKYQFKTTQLLRGVIEACVCRTLLERQFRD